MKEIIKIYLYIMFYRVEIMADFWYFYIMTQEEKQTLFIQLDELLDIFNEYSPIQDNGTVVLEVVKPTFLQMIEYIVPL